jgi:hypothetical protein
MYGEGVGNCLVPWDGTHNQECMGGLDAHSFLVSAYFELRRSLSSMVELI